MPDGVIPEKAGIILNKSIQNRLFYTVGMPLAGLAGLLLQQQAFRTGYDEKNLFLWGNPWTLTLLALCAVSMTALILVTNRSLAEGARYEALWTGNWLRGGLGILAGVMLAEDILYSLEPVTAAMKLMGFLAAGSMAACGVCFGLKKRPLWVLDGIVSLYFILRLLTGYRMWGSSAHLEQYMFPMLAGAMLVLYAFHRAEADAGRIRRKKLVISGYGAMLGCFIAAAGGRSVFYLMAVIWILSTMCSTEEVRIQKKN